MAGGRPLLFTDPAALEAKIEAYFESCWEEIWTEQRKLNSDQKPIKNSQGGFEMEWVPRLDRHGNTLLRQITPYTVAGLAVALECSRVTLINYQEKDEFFSTIKKAKDICEKFVEEGMFKGTIPAVPGIFNLKNNYGWVDKTEIDTNHTLQSMPTIKKDGKELTFNIGEKKPDAS